PDARPSTRFQLTAMRLAVQARAGRIRVCERDLARSLERAGRGDTDEGAVERAACQRTPDDPILACGEQERKRRRALAQVGARHLPSLDRLAGAVEDVVRDLEGDPERETELAELGPLAAGAESARRLEQLSRFQRA